MTVIEIVKDYLVKNGFDGLCGDDCGCGLDDLVLCDRDPSNCEPAYRRKCSGEKCACQCDAFEGNTDIFCYGTEKQEA